MTAPDGCPFHDLDPAATVWLDLDGVVLPYSAERACNEYHLGVALQPMVDRAMQLIDQQIASHTDEPHPVGKPSGAVQNHPPVWDSHPQHHRWDYIPELGGWVTGNDPDTLCTHSSAIPWQPTFATPPPHPRCLLGECPCDSI